MVRIFYPAVDRFFLNLDRKVAIFGQIDFAHSPLAYLFQDLVMATVLTDHTTPPRAMQFGSLLRGEVLKGNGKGRDLLDSFPGQDPGQFLAIDYSRRRS